MRHHALQGSHAVHTGMLGLHRPDLDDGRVLRKAQGQGSSLGLCEVCIRLCYD